MPQATIISDEVRTVEVTLTDDQFLVDPSRLMAALGWKLQAQGLCRGDACVPVHDVDALYSGAQLDVAKVAVALGRQVVCDSDARVMAVALSSEQRHDALDGLRAPSFALRDIEGTVHQFEEWAGLKKLLLAFSSW